MSDPYDWFHTPFRTPHSPGPRRRYRHRGKWVDQQVFLPTKTRFPSTRFGWRRFGDPALRWYRKFRADWVGMRFMTDLRIRRHCDRMMFLRSGRPQHCDHDWNNDGNDPTECLRCGMSFQYHVHMECS